MTETKTISRKGIGSNISPELHEKIQNPIVFKPITQDLAHGYAAPDDGVYQAMAELDAMPAPLDVPRAVTRLRAHGFGAECDVLLGRSDAAWSMLRALRDALRRMDPAWCALHGETQLDDEELDEAMSTLEDLLEREATL